MYLVDVTRRTNTAGTFSLYAIGDLHSDRREFQLARFEAYRAHIIADPVSVAVVVGDTMEGRTPGMKHFDPSSIRPDFLHNLESYVKHALWWNTTLLKPLVDAGVPTVILEGNHDRYQEYSGYAAMLADRVGAHYLGGEGFIRVRSGNARAPRATRSGTTHGRPRAREQRTGAPREGYYTTVIHATHGSGGGKQPGGKVNAMQQTLVWTDADVVLAGHVHDGNLRVIHRYGVPRKGALELVKTPVAMYRAPSFVERSLVGLVNYAGRGGYPSTDEGLQYLVVNPHHRTMTRREVDVAGAA